MPEQLPPAFTPLMTPSIMRRGDSICCVRCSPLYNESVLFGSAKQKAYRLITGLAPSPKPMVSRFTPTIPVIAPPKGSNADGLLCVSTLSVKSHLSSKAIAPELSLKTETQKSLSPFALLIFSVAPLIYVLNNPSVRSSRESAKIVCLQCSDHVCAIDSSSTSVGFLCFPRKYV